MGTPEFAIPSLHFLLEAGYNVVAVVTAVDKLGGRGRKTALQSAIKKFALEKNLRILQPKNLKAKSFHETLVGLNPDLQVVVAFRMLPEVVWSLPAQGTVNLHASLLPKYRGAAPINWAIIKGEVETGLTTFFIQKEIDTGAVLYQEKVPIYPYEHAGHLHDRMKYLGAELVLKTVNAIFSNQYQIEEQDHSQATKAPKIYHEMCKIDFNQTTVEVYNFIRGLNPFPAAWTTLQGKAVKLYAVDLEETKSTTTPGAVISDEKNFLKMATLDGYISIKELRMEGKKRMGVKAFLNGYSFG
jgi:methionyl-tRNA formyltransferase